ncbi:MAG: mechanosensitive ion channel family protein [Pseudobdellovibrionaceae bacterium]
MSPFFEADNMILLGGFVASLVFLYLGGKLVHRFSRTEMDTFLKSFYRNLIHPVQFLIGATLFYSLLQQYPIAPGDPEIYSNIYNVLLVTGFGWLALRLINLVSDVILRRFNIETKNNLNARAIHTQIKVLTRFLKALVFLIALSAGLMTFETIRSLGVSLLASAGVASVIIGFAAQKTIANFFTGLQIAITQPIRLGDAVVVEGEWGWIEEINLTYVVVKIWDWRRLVLPITYFVEHPFQNWTRRTASIIGDVTLYLDYKMPIEPLRLELDHILAGTELWDNDVKVVQVVDTTEKTMKVRVLVSATDSSTAWDLRCLVREKMIGFVQENYPQFLPQNRAEISGADDALLRSEKA